jgi:hypothetical protein
MGVFFIRCVSDNIFATFGCAMTQAVSHRPLTVEARVRAGVSPCGRQSGIGTGFFSEFLGFPCQYHSTVALHTHISSGE